MKDELKSGIYCIENIKTNKKYIGQSIDIKERWKKHIYALKNKRHPNDYLQKAWDKYKEECFKFYVLEYCEIDELDAKEINYINLYNTTDRSCGYNLKFGGQNGGSKYTDESREKMSRTQKELCKDPKNLEKLRQYSIKNWVNEEYRQSRSGKNHPLYGKHLSEETRKKISDANKEKPKPPRSKQHCEAISKSHKGKESPKKNTTPVKCVELNLTFKDAITAGKELNIKSSNHVIDVCMGRRQTCGGYHFEFVDNIGENNIS